MGMLVYAEGIFANFNREMGGGGHQVADCYSSECGLHNFLLSYSVLPSFLSMLLYFVVVGLSLSCCNLP